ncbi:MAG: protein translocase subunit SecF [Gemmatimonadetes bacterium]|nr:protein translocase subunit SecF [Gemmatimonadota bacterium]
MRFFANVNYGFMERRKWAYIFSAAVILVGLGSIVAKGGVEYSVEFTGGTLLQIEFRDAVGAAAVRSAFGAAGFGDAQVQNFGSDREFLIRLAEFVEGGDRTLAERVRSVLAERFGADAYEVRRTEAIGPKVGGELRRKAVGAVAVAFLLTLVYLAFRFEWRFGLAAIIATLHDTLITFGFISMLGVEISLTTVAAILTIIGYSLNDTIVIFDRIRENLRKRRRDPYIEILNRSINETLPRTTLTGGTSLLTLMALLVFGGAVIREFATVLALGVAIGTFSSIFVASPVLLEIQLRWGKLRGERGGERGLPEKRPTATPV